MNVISLQTLKELKNVTSAVVTMSSDTSKQSIGLKFNQPVKRQEYMSENDDSSLVWLTNKTREKLGITPKNIITKLQDGSISVVETQDKDGKNCTILTSPGLISKGEFEI